MKHLLIDSFLLNSSIKNHLNLLTCDQVIASQTCEVLGGHRVVTLETASERYATTSWHMFCINCAILCGNTLIPI